MIKGSCLCGAVTFEAEHVVGPFELCHCTRCRKVSAGAFMPAIGVAVKGYRMLSGHQDVQQFQLPVREHPPGYLTLFCRNCGSPVPPPQPEGEWFEIPAGILDTDPGIRPDKHIYVDYRAPWVGIAEGLPRYTKDEIRTLRSATNPIKDDEEKP